MAATIFHDYDTNTTTTTDSTITTMTTTTTTMTTTTATTATANDDGDGGSDFPPLRHEHDDDGEFDDDCMFHAISAGTSPDSLFEWLLLKF